MSSSSEDSSPSVNQILPSPINKKNGGHSNVMINRTSFTVLRLSPAMPTMRGISIKEPSPGGKKGKSLVCHSVGKGKRPHIIKEPRVLTVRVGGEDLTDEGYCFVMTGTQPFQILYENYSEWQNYTRDMYDLWYGDLKLSVTATPDEVGLPDEARVVGMGKYSWMNMDSRVVLVRLIPIVNSPKGFRFTMTKEQEMRSVYQRVARRTTTDLPILRLGVKGFVIGPAGRVSDTAIRNEDDLWWMEYPADLDFTW